uniref:DUF4062 domain-containing protein n=1 Tax=Salmo trutta TaxID=8032 RepID=A0A673WHM2_SALTR
MSSERNALLDKAYPELQTFCQSLGLVFEVVDMRWGLRDAIAVDQMTTELCLQEIQACKRVSVGPSFLVGLLCRCAVPLAQESNSRLESYCLCRLLFQTNINTPCFTVTNCALD